MKKKLTITNIIIIFMVALFVLDRYILFDKTILSEENAWFAIIMGFIPGKITEWFGLITKNGLIVNIHSIFTHIFLHTFVIHLLFNVLAFYKVGNAIEKKYGKIVLTLVFLLIGPIVGLFANFLVPSDNSLTVGASGSVFALIGISTVTSINEKGFTKSNYNFWWILYLLFYGILLTLTAKWTFVAHTGGFILGIMIGVVLKLVNKNKVNILKNY